jgi:hypothetical protein
MTFSLFVIALLCISLFPIMIHKKSQGHHVPMSIIMVSTMLFFITPIVAIIMVLQHVIATVFTIILGAFS